MTVTAPRNQPNAERPSPTRPDGYLPIESYAAIGDGRSVALVGADGSIDWMCLPDLEGPSVFGALLDAERGGRFVVAPAIPSSVRRCYVERTNVLETTFATANGAVRVTDALTIGPGRPAPERELVRQIDGLSGAVPMSIFLEPRFAYGQHAARFERHGPSLVTRRDRLQLGLRTWDAGEPLVAGGAVRHDFEIGAGERALIVMTATEEATLPIPERDRVERRLADTTEAWRAWIRQHSYDGPWTGAVERSLLAIRLLADDRTGAIAAAATTSLPEALGAERNYDYRFAWVRDLCFALDALLGVGVEQPTQASIAWLLEATMRTHPRIDPVYSLAGEVVRDQRSLALPGYRRTAPVHVGNGAGRQLQLGGFGDLMETIAIYTHHGHVLAPAAGERLADAGELLRRLWRHEDAGLWELPQYAQYGTSKLGAWVAFDRLLSLAEAGCVPDRHRAGWVRERDGVREFIERHLFSESRNSYVQKVGAEALDCGMLLAARRRFTEPGSPRLRGTIDAIQAELGAGGPLLYRYTGMQEEENAFLACSFWMVEALALAGRADEAGALMDELLAVGNDVGLYAEEIEPGTRSLRGNFPQALTHLSLINAALACSN